MVPLTKDFVRPEIPKPTELEVSETNRLVIAFGKRRCLLIARALTISIVI